MIFGVLEISSRKETFIPQFEAAALPTLKLGAVCVQLLVSIVCVCIFMTPSNEFHIIDPMEFQTEK